MTLAKTIQIKGQVLTQITKFKSLGPTVTINNRLDAVLDTRTSNVSKAFGARSQQRPLHKNKMCCVSRHSSLNPPVWHRNFDGVQSGYPKISRLYDASLAQNTKCQVGAVYPK